MTKRPPVSPLIDVQTNEFAMQYQYGVWWSMYDDEQGQGSVRDSYLVTNLQSCLVRGYFDGQHDSWLSHLGFFLGMYHGGVLDPETGHLRPDVTTLAILTNSHAQDSYSVGREDFFTGLDPQERRYSETALLHQIRNVALESPFWKEPSSTWFSYVGCLLGELSGNLFPMTEHDRLLWKQSDQRHQERIKEPLPVAVPQEA